MPKLVITSSKPLEVGKVYNSMYDQNAVLRLGQFFKVVRKSTRQEWVDCLVSFGEERAWAEMLSVLDPYFYEIQTD